MGQLLVWIAILAFAAAIMGLGVIGYRAYASGASPGSLLFRAKDIPRVEVMSQINMDGRRKLVLIRRDDVEHLIMTGGPVDVVVETGITNSNHAPALPALPQTAPPLTPALTTLAAVKPMAS